MTNYKSILLFSNNNVQKILVVVIVIAITISSFWCFIGGKALIGWYDYRFPNENLQPIIIQLDGKTIAKSDEDNLKSIAKQSPGGSNSVELILLPGTHTLKLSFENGTIIDEYKFMFDYHLYIGFSIINIENIEFNKVHSTPRIYGENIIGLSNIDLMIYLIGLVVLYLFTFKYLSKLTQKGKYENNGLEKEQGKNNESNSKNKGG